MRSSKSRSRGNKNRNNRPSGGNLINRVFDSSGPDGKVRGTPQQIIEKYNQLHRDSQLSNDRVNAENFAQHAEHYTRMLAEAQREVDKQRDDQDRENRERQAERDRQVQADRERQAERDREREANRERERQNQDRNQERAAERRERTDDDAAPADDDAARAERPARAARPPRAPRATPNEPRSDQNDRDERQSTRERERADRLRAQEEAFNGPTPSMLVDPSFSGPSGSDQPDLADDDSGLVDTPESKPKPTRVPRPRKPRVAKVEAIDTPGAPSVGSEDAAE